MVATAGTTPSVLRQPQAPGDIGEFVAFCPFSHRLPDDPIVFPRQPGRSHNHDFFGNRTTNATSTIESLLAGDSNCDPLADRSPYWVSTLYDAKQQPVPVEQATFYYLVSVAKPETVRAFPLGLRIIAGSPAAASPPNPSHVKWSCLGSAVSSTSEPVVCPAGSKLELLVNFPDCWNGVDLDSADHQGHMAYSSAKACPASHPVAVPLVQFKLRYASPGEPGMTLSSGPGYTAHADFFNAWEPLALENRVNCLRRLIKCGPEGLPYLTYLPLLQR